MLSSRISQVFRFSNFRQHGLTLLNHSEKLAYVKMLEDNVDFEYKQYPLLPHQNSLSPEYIQSELDTYHEQTETKAFNKLIDQFKHDLKVQKEVWEALDKLDRPYKRGIKGIDTNLTQQLAKPNLPDLGFQRRVPQDQHRITFMNEDRFISNTNFPTKDQFNYQHIKEWEKERLNRPVTKDYNHAKGYKYDVPIKPEQKYEYVCDRLGHPEFIGSPFDRLFKLQKDIYHPTYLDQPFVKMPSQYPSKQLNFEQGEVLYENTRVLEWIRAFQYGNIGLLAYAGIFIPLNLIFKTNLVLEKADELWIGQQHLWTPYTVDILHLFTPISTVGVFYILYSTMRIITQYAAQYAVKVSYSKDKQLLFVKRVNNYGMLVEDVYETAHLQILPPRQRSGVASLSSQDEDGLWSVTCLNTNNTIVLYNDDRFWNRNLKAPFLQGILNFWDKSYYGYTRDQDAQVNRKFREEVEASFNQQALPSK